MMFKKAVAAVALSLGLVFVAPVAAQAATVGGGCRLSANWWVTTSANWNGNQLTYVVVNSPGPLWFGSPPAAGHTSTYALWNSHVTNVYWNANPNIYRADIYQNASEVTAVIYGGEHGRCTARMVR